MSVKKAVDVLKKGGVIVYPTDTLFGLGVDATNKKAVKKLFEIKKRDETKPISIIVSNVEMAKEYCKIDEKDEEILKKYLPGPYTFLLKKLDDNLPKELTMFDKIRIRIPDNKICIEIVEKLGKPITATSANISGEKSPAKIEDVPDEIKKIAFVVDGECKYGEGSTIVDLTDGKVIRMGAGKWNI